MVQEEAEKEMKAATTLQVQNDDCNARRLGVGADHVLFFGHRSRGIPKR